MSVALQEAVESVVTGTSPEDAAADYQSALEEIVGADAVASADADAPPAPTLLRAPTPSPPPAADATFASDG